MIPVSASNDSDVATDRTFREFINSLSHNRTSSSHFGGGELMRVSFLLGTGWNLAVPPESDL
jgi:hypothetical protein